MLVKEFIKELEKFNPNAEILNTINLSWESDDISGDWDIDEDKRTTKRLWIFDESYGEEMVSDE